MRILLTIFVAVLIAATVCAQSPEKLSYRAVIRNSSNALVKNATIGMRISILHGSASGTVIYSENQTTTTNAEGVASIDIGGAAFKAITWTEDPYFIKAETDPKGGTNYTIIITSQLLNVPNSSSAKSSENNNSGFVFSAPANQPSIPTNASIGDILFWNGTAWTKLPVGTPGQFLRVSNSNIPEWFGSSFPIITTSSVSNITGTSVTIGGNVTSDGGVKVAARGICWNTTDNSATAIDKTIDGNGMGSFTSSVTGLTPGVTYYFWAYATNSVGTVYGNKVTTTTKAILPVITTSALSEIKSTSATSGGNISRISGAAVTSRGVCWSASQNPTTSNSKTTDGVGSGSFTSTISGLNPGKVYYFRAYATNSIGTAYGNQITLSTPIALPVITTAEITSVSSKTASSGGSVISDGGTTITARGICWSTSQNPTTANSKTTDGTGSGSFKSVINGLNPGVTYYYRAYATNKIGTSYGDQVTLNMKIVPPEITTTAISEKTATSLISGGNITSDGGSAVIARGLCWSTSQNPTTANAGPNESSGSGSFVYAITDLSPGVTYYIRAYATNSVGTAYGNQITTSTSAVLPILNTTPLSAITATIAMGGGFITSDGGSPVSARGVCWSKGQNPTISDFKTSNGTGFGSFSSTIKGLSPGAVYYIRAYATNSIGTAYGNLVSTTTSAVLPVITTSSLSEVSSTSATGGGNITDDGSSAVISRGLCWSPSQNPTTADSKTNDGAGTGSFKSSINGLKPGITYYFRAFATNKIGTAYGNQISVTTAAVIPVLTTNALSQVSTTVVSAGGNITNDGGASITTRGICWSTTQNPTTANSKSASGSGSGSFTSSVTGLNPGVNYYFRAYATNSVGTAYGNQVSMTTSFVAPSVNTTNVSAVTTTTVMSGGDISNDGGTAVTERGVCWSITPNPIVSNSKTVDGTGNGSFKSSITGLNPGTFYYFRAYATNSIGTAYGNQLTATTTAVIPEIITTQVSAMTATTLTSGGNISSDGGAAITERGVCWSTSQNPTTANTKPTDSSGSGSFEYFITDLTPGVTYYLRAYATNSVGTAYGNQITATTTAVLPVLTTNSVSAIKATTAVSGGFITSDGGSPVTARGVCWSKNQNPTISDKLTSNGTGFGSFSSSITGLTSGEIYYIRAYATNSIGTAYGNQVTTAAAAAVPAVTTRVVEAITEIAATSGGNITGDGGSGVTARGVCWSTTQNPTISNSKTVDGTGGGSFASSLIGLAENTTYYVRAYATNIAGTGYGTEVTFKSKQSSNGTITDIDGNVYHTVAIDKQVWLVENLKTAKYRNGDVIGTTNPATLDILTQSAPKYQWPYDGKESNVSTYGRLYTWYAVTDSRGVCPLGYHIPTDSELTVLTTFLGGESVAGGKLKATGTGHWASSNAGATNITGFTALPGGLRGGIGKFYYLGSYGFWWSSTENLASNAWGRRLTYYYSDVTRNLDSKSNGFSVRCIMD